MGTFNLAQLYAGMSPEDKEALKQLKAQEEARTGHPVSLSDIIAAVTPGMKDPAYLSV